MATFNPPSAAAPDSLESVLNSLQNLIDSNRHRPAHSRVNPSPEPFSNQTEPLISEQPPATNVTKILQQHIPVLNDVINCQADDSSPQAISESEIEKTLNELRTELSSIVADIMLDTRKNLHKPGTSSQEIIQTGLKDFLNKLATLEPR